MHHNRRQPHTLRLTSLISTLLVVLALLGFGTIGVQGALVQEAPNAAPDAAKVQLLVKFKDGASAADMQDAIQRGGGQQKRKFAQIRTRVMEVPAVAAQNMLEAYARHPAVERAAQAVRFSQAGDPGDPGYAQQWALPKIGWDQAYGVVPITGTATIAVLDTGVDATHPDLAGRVVAGFSAFDGGNASVDPNGHGTALAGIAAAETGNAEGIAGVAYAGVSVMPVQVLAADGTGTDADVIAGVQAAIDAGAKVILMGFSSPDYSAALADELALAWNSGAVLVAATGNGGSGDPTYPAGNP